MGVTVTWISFIDEERVTRRGDTNPMNAMQPSPETLIEDSIPIKHKVDENVYDQNAVLAKNDMIPYRKKLVDREASGRRRPFCSQDVVSLKLYTIVELLFKNNVVLSTNVMNLENQ
ncbi:unnamed protein product [Angiostrongylus costaricensis]|uniref:DDE_Tnp_1_7 domain-containing protein n=1 Tax=Angiostrongylus costaricensis TaxID=334426 RepID=A0A0R3PZI5_ANGCS|nr:unnamed protein product [Angiostrongylus costaricensis]